MSGTGVMTRARSAGGVPLEISGEFLADAGKSSGISENTGLEVTEPQIFGLDWGNIGPLRGHESAFGGEHPLQNGASAIFFQFARGRPGEKLVESRLLSLTGHNHSSPG